MRGPSTNYFGPKLDCCARRIRAVGDNPERALIVINAVCALILVALTVVLVLQGG